MGDLMHALPALTDAAKQIPNIEFDWVVDENFSEVPLWHPNVKSVIKTNHRTWKKNIFSFKLVKQLVGIKKILNNKHYDVVIDMQNNLKSAAVSFLINKPVHGMDRTSVREYPAHLAYDFKYKISKENHAIVRQRELMAMSLGYKANQEKVNYGTTMERFESFKTGPIFSTTQWKKSLVLVHNASRPNKMWPISFWQDLIEYMDKEGYRAVLPSGSKEEYLRAKEIASSNEKSFAIEPMSLNETAYIINISEGCVCSDTGLAHLAALLNKPSVTMYSVTDKNLIGTTGENQKHIVSSDSRMESIPPRKVWEELKLLMSSGGG